MTAPAARPGGGDASEGATSERGIVYLIGAGPGDPGLLTVRARELLDTCDAIVHDALANPEIVRDALAPERHFVGKRGGDERSSRQEEINALLVRLGREGKRVARLKGGDPFVFGRGSEEAQALAAAGVPFEVVPGVTAGIAAPAYAGIPVTHRGLSTSVTLVTGHEDPAKGEPVTDWSALARAGGTIVLYMGVRTLPRVARALIDGGLAPDTPAAAVQWGTYGRQRTVAATLATLADAAAREGITAPVITVIGRVVALRDEIRWFDRRPLSGARILVTRARRQASALVAPLRALGADVTEMPATRIEPLDPAPLIAALRRIADYRWLVITSPNGAGLVWDALRADARDARALAPVRIAAIGPSTADALLAHGLAVDLLPERFVAESVLAALRDAEGAHGLRGARVLYAAAEGAREVLAAGLREAGAAVDVVPVYRSVPDGEGAAEARAMLERGELDLVTMTSSSGVEAYVRAVGIDAARRAPVASIGPVTSEAARRAGLTVALEAATSTIPGLVDAIARDWPGRG